MLDLKFDSTKHKIVLTGEDEHYSVFTCCLCETVWERCQSDYVVEGESVLGRCCPECFLFVETRGSN
jgi:hypothetical protein